MEWGKGRRRSADEAGAHTVSSLARDVYRNGHHSPSHYANALALSAQSLPPSLSVTADHEKVMQLKRISDSSRRPEHVCVMGACANATQQPGATARGRWRRRCEPPLGMSSTARPAVEHRPSDFGEPAPHRQSATRFLCTRSASILYPTVDNDSEPSVRLANDTSKSRYEENGVGCTDHFPSHTV